MYQALNKIEISGIVEIRDKLLKCANPLRLESGEPYFAIAEHIRQAYHKALIDNQTHYVDSQGILPLRKAIVEKLNRENKIDSSISEVLVTNGGMHALYTTFLSILSPGDEVIIPSPNWTCVQWLIEMIGAVPVHVNLHENLGFRFDLDELNAAITPKTKAILINSPHNPTGGVFTREDLRQIMSIAERNDMYLISDEAYEHIIYEEEHVSACSMISDFPSLREKIISVFTFSKSYAMTGLRLGYLHTYNKSLIANMKKVVLYTANGINSVTQWAGVAALENNQDHVLLMRNEFAYNRDILFAGINKSKHLKVATKAKGAFYLFAKIDENWQGYNGKKEDKDMVAQLIDSAQLGCTPGSIFGPNGKGFVRFSYACSPTMVKEAARLIQEIA